MMFVQQKYQTAFCSVTNIEFNVQKKRNTQSFITFKQKPKQGKQKQLYKPFIKHQVQTFIPTTFSNPKKQLLLEYNVIKKKEMKPLKAHQLQHKGFPSRKIFSSQSCRSIQKKQKKFSFGQPEPCDYFSNKIISESVTQSKLAQSQPSSLNRSVSSKYKARRKSHSEFEKPKTLNIFQYRNVE